MDAESRDSQRFIATRRSTAVANPGAVPGIESTPGVCGGDARIAGTRIPVWTLEEWRRLGQTESEILANYPGLCAADLVTAWAYVEEHLEEIDETIRLNGEDADEAEETNRPTDPASFFGQGPR